MDQLENGKLRSAETTVSKDSKSSGVEDVFDNNISYPEKSPDNFVNSYFDNYK